MRVAVVLAAVGMVTASAIIPQAYPILPLSSPESYSITLGVWIKSHYLGVVHELADGQLRVGDGSIPVANFTFTPNTNGVGGGIVDSYNHGCIATPGPHQQFQCDEGVRPGPGFDISCGGRLTYHGSEEFWACPVDDNGIRNLYVEPVPKQMLCRYVYIHVVGTSLDVLDRPGCIEKLDSKPWIFVWDKLYNNSNPVHPDSPDGPRQMEGWQKYSNGAPIDEIVGKPHQNHTHQSHSGHCGQSTGLDCYGKADGPCCSSYGWCGLSAQHCGSGCQSDFGVCDSSPSAKPSHAVSTSDKGSKTSTSVTKAHTAHPTPSVQKHNSSSPDGRCGGKDGYSCAGFSGGPCCSAKGWCGTSFLHCAPSQGCQPGYGKCGILHPGNEVQYNKTDNKMPTPHIGIPTHTAPSHATDTPAHVSKPSSSHGTKGAKETESSELACNDSEGSKKCGDRTFAHGCPHDLEGDFEFPHLMVPVNKKHQHIAMGNQFNGTIDNEHCTIYNFDISPKQGGKKCSLIWIFPEKGGHKDGSFAFNSNSDFPVMEFWHLGDLATEKTTWDTVGSKQIIAAGPVRPGFNCNAKTVQCAAGSQQAFMVCGQDFALSYFQDSGARPMGLYVRTC